MTDIILKAENISKQYRLGLVGTGTISHDLNRWWYRIRGKEDPYLKVGESNDRSTKGNSDYVWALQDINFEVKRGEVLGIIGKNGAGKSTLLKILSKVTSPTTGVIKTRGRIASLLEVGTGFHGEMTGRENIYLNGAILGMTKKEVSSKIEEIIEFSGCQRYIDTPVKRYSSGMTVRLAFAVAAFLEPEILVIDEVLAVGDAEFQKKAIGKMQDISKGEGRTVLFVSHDLSAISVLANRTVVLANGRIAAIEETSKAISYYSSLQTSQKIFKKEPRQTAPSVTRVEITASEGGTLHANGEAFKIDFEINMPEDNYQNLAFSFQILNNLNKAVTFTYAFDLDTPLCRKKGINKIRYVFNKLRLYKGNYHLRIHLANSKTREKFQEFDCCNFQVEMLNQKEPEWGWQNNVCQYIEEGEWKI
ncbi:ABC transporter ATP-binding protein [Jejuia pallidilutea]|uniref:Polysaccharide ABC transporter ATP-binding protein n=1 Tax=Jejuia pallidilutea TaxID=504487 RepID=A0A090W371_9FLAO|nr:ABC transporter ATP-binding protein [Jejuia pallidilutea]GAL67636.1 polysaccharide ABC transporter ATP-binding protein [Jejuia pallidilutea]GAL71445.1 polysaccharide ABC transporter ATP-binding protein [Jejuia pallidilutea]GAL89451.1 polysaccharide ABC transporter ATP-binding protein [Jejuia pallidilutea]